MPSRPLIVVVTALSGLLVACGDSDEAPAPDPASTPGTPQGPAPRAGVRSGELPPGTTLTGAPARALTRVGDTVYAAGVDWVAPLRGSSVALSPRTGMFSRAFGTNGRIADAVADGRGGVYLAGDFDRVGTATRRGLVHIFSTGDIDRRFRPRLDGSVASLALDGGILYAGGSPDGPRGPGVRGVVALSSGTGQPLPGFETDVAPGVTKLALRAGTLYVGGSSPGLRRRLEGVEATAPREAPLVALDGRSGDREPGFAPAPLTEAGNASVSALRVIDGSLWVGRSGSGGSGAALTLLDPETGAVKVPEPDPETGVPPTPGASVRGTVRELVRDGGRVIAVGDLRARGGRDLAQALDPATGARRGAWRVRAPGGERAPTAGSGLITGDTLWLGGAARTGSRRDGFVGAYGLRSGAPRAGITAPVPDGPVEALVSAGGRVVAAGDFVAADVRRQDLAAFDATTGGYAAGVRLPATRAASALASAGGRLWVVDGRRLLVVDPATGGVVKRIRLPRGDGMRLTAAAGRVFVSGRRDLLPGGLLAYDGATGARVAFRLPPSGAGPRPPVPLGDGRTLWVAGGPFDRERSNDRPRTLGVVRLDAATGKLDPAFDARVRGPVRALALIDDRLYVGGRFRRVGDLRRRNLAAVDPATGSAIRAFEPGPSPAGRGVRLERLRSALLVTVTTGRSRAFGADGGPASRTVKGASRVSATVSAAGSSQLVAGTPRSSATGATPRPRGVVLPPRG